MIGFERELEVYYPKGLRISIRDQLGIRFVVFHVSINKEMHENAAGDISKKIMHPNNGQWTFENNHVHVKLETNYSIGFMLLKIGLVTTANLMIIL